MELGVARRRSMDSMQELSDTTGEEGRAAKINSLIVLS